jgi:acyl-CoA thioester hydrolase
MPNSIIPAPLSLSHDHVHAEWIDYNGHMNEGYYGVAFSNASDELLLYLGLGSDYPQRTNYAIYTVENHISYLRELKEGAPLRFTSQLLGCDAKRIHAFHAMYHAEEGYLAATMESMMIHVSQKPLRSAAMPQEILAHIEEIVAVHKATLPRPPQAGRSIGLRSKKD